MSKFSRTFLFINVLLINIFIAGCSCGETPEEKNKEELVKKEKELVGGLKKEFEKAGYSLDQSAEVVKVIERIKNEASVEDLDKMIKFLEDIMAGKGMEGSSGPEEPEENSKEYDKEEMPKFMQYLKELSNAVDDHPENKNRRNTNEELEEAQAKQRTLKVIEIFKNFKKQAELKNKGKE